MQTLKYSEYKIEKKILTPVFIIKWAVVHPNWAPFASPLPSMSLELMTFSIVFRQCTTLVNKIFFKLTLIIKCVLKSRNTVLWMAIYALQECIPPIVPLPIQ